MKNVFKSITFLLIFVFFIYILNYLLIPKYELLKPVSFEISGEKDDTIDVIFLGDSLVYSSVSPMEIWNEYGYTSFECAEPAQILPDTYDYLEFAVKHQHPKIVMLEANVLFRNPKKRTMDTALAQAFRRYVPISVYHNNWKSYLQKGSMENWINIDKGYKFIPQVKPSNRKKDYMAYTDRKESIPKNNFKYIEKIIKLCEKNDIKLILVGFPSQASWRYNKHNAATAIAEKYGLDFINLNLEKLDIDWKKDTKDKGSHLNNSGSKKVSKFIGNYLKNTNLLEDHRKDSEYEDWNTAYKLYLNHPVQK